MTFALHSLRSAIVTMLAALATLGCVLAVDPEPGPAVLAVVLCVSLGRSQVSKSWQGRIETGVVLALVGHASIGVGALFQRMPWVGAVVYVAGMFLSIWLRRFGGLTRRVGALIALPFVVILVVPRVQSVRVSGILAVLLPVLVALIALLWVSVFQWLAAKLRVVSASAPSTASAAASTARPPSTKRLAASTQMAVQMAVALSVAFAVGFVFFPERWAWIVLTAYIVGSGNRGRGDVVYKSVLRIGGAAVGTAGALLFTQHLGGKNATTVVLILGAVFLAVWLRPLGYAWWALFVTLALALLQGFTGEQAQLILWPRLEEIVIGAVIGVAAAWFVLPVRSADVLRRRLADALVALAESLDSRSPDAFVAAVAQLEQVAPAFRARRMLLRPGIQSADWIDEVAAFASLLPAVIASSGSLGEARRAIGAAR
ncbi:MAG: FUSC family protein, partial [Lacisediminihabitans sp.]